MAQTQVANLTSEERDRLVKALKETSNSLARAEGERTFVTETVKKLVDDLKLPKRLVNKLVKVYHKQNFAEEVAEHEQLERIYNFIKTA